MFEEARRTGPYRELTRKDFDDTFDFIATGGYALGAYEKWRRLFAPDGRWRWRGRRDPAVPAECRHHRRAAAAEGEAQGGPVLGEVEEAFIQGLVAGDTFIFAGRLLRYEGIRQLHAEVTPAKGGEDPKVPAYGGGRLPLSTYLAERVRGIIADPGRHHLLPDDVQEWLRIQRLRSRLPHPDRLLIEGFPRGSRQFLVAYCFEGRNAHQTLGMLLTRRMERMGLRPLGFVATDYVLGIWGLRPATPRQIEALFDEDMLGDDLEAWMDESSMLRRSFRNVAVIAGLIDAPSRAGETRRQVTFSADLIYDALRKHEPDILLRHPPGRGLASWTSAARSRAAPGKIDYHRSTASSPLGCRCCDG